MRIYEDLKAFSKDSKKKMITVILTNPCFHSVVLYRIAALFNKMHLTFLSKILWYITRLLYHVDIDYRADLAGGFVLIHGLGTVIGSSVKSMGRLTVYQGVTIGGSMRRSRDTDIGTIWQPIIGENVTLYTDAKVFGPIFISDNCVIKAGQIITHDL